MSYDDVSEKVSEIGDAFRTHSALIGCSMFFTIGMIIDCIKSAWPDLQAISLSAFVWVLILIVQCYVFEETRRRTALRLQATLRAWYLRGPGAYGASLIEAEPLGITYEYLGRKKRAVIAFLWSRIEFKLV